MDAVRINLESKWLGIFLTTVLFLSITFSAFYRLTESPGVWYDEGFYVQVALQISKSGIPSLQIGPNEHVSASHVSVGFPVTYPLALVFKVFGPELFAARALMAIFLVLFCFAVYFFVSQSYGKGYGLMALALIGSFPPLYGNGKSILGEVPGMLYFALFLSVISHIERSQIKKSIYYLFAGILAGLAIVTKPIFILLVPAILTGLVVSYRSLNITRRNLLTGIVGLLFIFAIWLVTQFRSGDSLVSVLSYYSNPYHIENIFAVVSDNFLRFFSEPTPIYALSLMVIWLASIVIRSTVGKKVGCAEFIAVIFSVLVYAAYLRTAGWYRYFFVAHVISMIFVPMAISSVLEIRAYIHARRAIIYTVLTVIILFSIHVYQLLFSSWVAGYYASSRSAELAAALQDMPTESTVLLYDVPELAIFLPNDNYRQYIKPVPGVLEYGIEERSKLRTGYVDYVIIKKNEIMNNEITKRYSVVSYVAEYAILMK